MGWGDSWAGNAAWEICFTFATKFTTENPGASEKFPTHSPHLVWRWYCCPVVGSQPVHHVSSCLAWGVSRISLSEFEHISGPETNVTLITGRVWQMGLPCILSGTSGLAPPCPQRPKLHIISGTVGEISSAFLSSLREMSHSEIYHREVEQAPNTAPSLHQKSLAASAAVLQCRRTLQCNCRTAER